MEGDLTVQENAPPAGRRKCSCAASNPRRDSRARRPSSPPPGEPREDRRAAHFSPSKRPVRHTPKRQVRATIEGAEILEAILATARFGGHAFGCEIASAPRAPCMYRTIASVNCGTSSGWRLV